MKTKLLIFFILCITLLGKSQPFTFSDPAFLQSTIQIKTFGPLIPVMTSATTPSGIVSSDSVFPQANIAAWKSFDSNSGTYWSPSSTIAGETHWLQYQFTTSKLITQYSMTSFQTSQTWTFSGSTNGTTWDILNSQTNVNQNNTFTFTNSNSYTYFRFTFILIGNSCSVIDSQMYGY